LLPYIKYQPNLDHIQQNNYHGKGFSVGLLAWGVSMGGT
jgi:hypothetical protein